MKTRIALFLFLALPICSLPVQSQILLDSIPDTAGYTYMACPDAPGPFPGILYNHGGLGPLVGGDLRQTVIELANLGYYARAEKRDTSFSIVGHLGMVEAALDSVINHPKVDPACITIMGFSRGGYLSLEAAKQNPDLVNRVILFAPADPAGLLSTLVEDVSPINDQVLILIADNDTLQDPLTTFAQFTNDSLLNAGKQCSLIVYPGYDSDFDGDVDGLDDGHELFFSVQDPYWSDVVEFLDTSYCPPVSIEEKEFDKFKVYPNPAESYFVVDFGQHIQQAEFQLYDRSGKVVLTKEILNASGLIYEDSDLPAGMYFYSLNVEDRSVDRGKLVLK